MWKVAVILSVAALCHALPAQDTGRTENDLEGYGDCLRKDSAACIKYKLLSFVDKMLGQKETFAVADGVTVVRAADAQAVDGGAPRSLSTDPAARLRSYLDTHALRVELKGGDVLDAMSGAGRAFEDTVEALTSDDEGAPEEGRGKKKKAAKLLGPLMAALALKAAALLPLVLGAIALIAGKALLIGKLALVLSAVIGLKKLLSSQQKHVTYEVVAHPHHSSSHTSSHADYGASSGYGGDSGGYSAGASSGGHSSGGWGRSAQEIAYSAQKPQ